MFNRGLGIGRFAGSTIACVAAALTLATTATPSAAHSALYRPYVRTYNVTPINQAPTFGVQDLGIDVRVPVFKELDTTSIESAARDIAYGPDKNLWITSDCDGTILRITPGGAQRAFVYKPNNNCYSSTSITAGIDNTMWFADRFGNFVGRIDETGAIKLYPLPNDTCNFPTEPLSITLGPDGAMWFTAIQGGNPNCPGGAVSAAVVRLTLSGRMTFYFTGPRGFSGQPIPLRFATGTNRALTFTAALPQNGNSLAVGQITTTGVYSYTTAFGVPHLTDNYITLGPDGNMWVTSYNDVAIYAVAPNGQAATFPVPPVNGEIESPFGITVGPDRKLWFATRAGNQLGRLTTTGKFSFYAVPKGGQDNSGSGGDIALGANGSLWFTLPGNLTLHDLVKATNLP